MNCVNCGNAFVQGDITEFSFGAGSWLPCTENGVRKIGGTCLFALERDPSGIAKHRHKTCAPVSSNCARCGQPFNNADDAIESQSSSGKWSTCFVGEGILKHLADPGNIQCLHRHVECPGATLVCAHPIYGENLTKNLGRIGQLFTHNGKTYAVIGVRLNGYIVGYASRSSDTGYDLYIGPDEVLDLKVYDVRLGARGQGVTIKVEAKDAAEAKMKVLQDVEVHVVQPAS